MKLQTKVWLSAGVLIGAISSADFVLSYRQIEKDIRARLNADARIVSAMMMATRRVYHAQFLASGLPVDERTIGFLPAFAMSRISDEFVKLSDSGLRFNNVSDRPRNPANQADADELAAMDWFRAHRGATERVAEILDARGQRHYHFAKPIWIEPYCLTCHGSQGLAPASIRVRYADGFDYKVGELRGVMSIKLPLDALRTHKLQAWSHVLVLRGIGYAFLLVLLGSVMQWLVTRRLERLGAVAQRLQAGDMTARAKLEGSDEVAVLGGHFDGLAASLAAHEAHMKRLNQMHTVLARTNESIVRVSSEQELLACICQILVEHGALSAAWIEGAAVPCITILAGDGAGLGDVEQIHRSTEQAVEDDAWLSSAVWRTHEPMLIQRYAEAAVGAAWQALGQRLGWGSSGAFPIVRSGRLQLVLNVCSAESEVFDRRTVDLLMELAGDVGYGLDRLDLVRGQERTHAALAQSEAKYRAVIETSPDGYWLCDQSGRLLEVNDAYVRMVGYSREELLAMSVADLDKNLSPRDVVARLACVRKFGAERVETRHWKKNGVIIDVEVSTTFACYPGGDFFASSIRDLSARKAAEAHIVLLSRFDALTGLPNRGEFADRFQGAIAAARGGDEQLALIFLDLDHFSNINDSLGHGIGDQLLAKLARRLRALVRQDDVVARLGGDEFIILHSHASPQSVTHLAERILASIGSHLVIGGTELVITPSMGVAIYPDNGGEFESLLRCADTALRYAKQAGRNTYRFFKPAMQERSMRTLQLEAGLRKVLERRELVLHYQPQVDLRSGTVVAVEALVRWEHPEWGVVSPAEFIPLAEQNGLILGIGEWVLREACRQMRDWITQGLPLRSVAVNLSAVQFRQPELVASVTRILMDVGLPSSALELELTESSTADNPEEAIAIMDALHTHGIRTSIDDFGTGYSSLSYLQRFRVDKLKIDQSFVRDLGRNPESEAIVHAIVRLAEALRFTTIAEGVETGEQLNLLRAFGCDEIQGYYFSPPLPADELAVWMARWGADTACVDAEL